MPNLDYYLQIFSSPAIAAEQKQNLSAELNVKLYEHALKLIQQRVTPHEGEAKIIDGFMQDHFAQTPSNTTADSTNFRAILNTNTFFNIKSTEEANKLKIGAFKDLATAKAQFSEAEYQGFALINLENCEVTGIINPYSNPYFYGTELVSNLWTMTVNKIPFIYVPIINNTIYIDLVKKYYQPELYRAASEEELDFADEFTPPYLRSSRRTLLLLEALKCYAKLAIEVSELFVPEARENIKVRLFYATVVRNISKCLFNLEAWMQQLADSAPNESDMIIEYQKLLDDIKGNIDGCIVNIQDYINNLSANPYWHLEQMIELKTAPQANNNLPLHAASAQLVIEHNYSIVKYIWQKLWRSQELLDTYAGKEQPSPHIKKVILPLIKQLKDSGIHWLITHHLDLFMDSLKAAINNKSIRDAVLKVLNSTVDYKNSSGLIIGKIEILNDDQLSNIYAYVLKVLQNPATKPELLNLRWQNDLQGFSTNNYFITRKTEDHELRDPQLIRSIAISISKSGVKLSLHPSRKNVVSQPLLPKYKGHATTVTLQFDISPYHPDKLEFMQASKSIDLAPKNDRFLLQERIKTLNQSINIAKAMGHHVANSCTTYAHYKPKLACYRVAARITEEWAISNMQTFADHEYHNNDQLLMKDVDYKQAKDSGNIAEIARVKLNITSRLVGDLLTDLVKLHEDLKVIHRDIKPDNVLIYLKNGILRARLVDFDLSIYLQTIQTSDCQPVATCGFASPQVVGFTFMTSKKLIYTDLLNHLTDKFSDKSYRYVSFGRELFETNLQAVANKDEYDNMKPDVKDDTFSLGVTLFIFLTRHYPTSIETNKGNVYSIIDYMHVQQAYKQFPQFKELFEGLFMLERDKRLNSVEAMKLYERINAPNTVSKQTLTM